MPVATTLEERRAARERERRASEERAQRERQAAAVAARARADARAAALLLDAPALGVLKAELAAAHGDVHAAEAALRLARIRFEATLATLRARGKDLAHVCEDEHGGWREGACNRNARCVWCGRYSEGCAHSSCNGGAG